MRTKTVMGLVAILFSLSVSPAMAQAPAPAEQDAGGQMGADGGLLIDRIDPERLRQIRNERTRQFILGAGVMAAGGLIGFSKNEWPVDEGVVGIALGVLGLSLFIEPVTWRELEVRTTTNGLTLEW